MKKRTSSRVIHAAVTELAKQCRDKLEESIRRSESSQNPDKKLDAEIQALRAKINAHGYYVGLVLRQDDNGTVKKVQLAFGKIDDPGPPQTLH